MSAGTATTTTLSNTYQKHFRKVLLDHAVQLLLLNQFAMQADLPRKTGAKSISFFRREEASGSNVSTLTEGTPITDFINYTVTEINVPLVQYGEAAKITDIATMTQLLDVLAMHIEGMGEDCALHADEITRNVIQAGVTSAGQKRYAQGLADYAALAAASVAAGKTTLADIRGAITRLKWKRAPMFNGKYTVIAPPQVCQDVMDDTTFISLSAYGDSRKGQLVRGEVGEIYGGRFVEHTNPFIEDDGGSEGTYDAAPETDDAIFTTIVTGRGAYGTPKLGGTQKVPDKDRVSPEIIINDKADKSDPLNQFITAGWKNYWAAKVLNENWICTIRGKSAYESL